MRKISLCSLSVTIALVLCGSAHAEPQRLYGVNPFSNTFSDMDMGTFGLFELTLTGDPIAARLISVPTLTITGANAITIDPTTGIYYAIVKATGVTGRVLITIDPETGLGVQIGSTGLNISSIAFRADGQLFGVTGDGAAPAETLHTIDKTTGVATVAIALGNGNDGEVIATSPNDSTFYHFSGGSTAIVERIADAPPYTVTAVSAASSNGEVFGAVWDACRDMFIITTINSRLFLMAPDGTTVGPLGTQPNDTRGLALSIDPQCGLFADGFEDPPPG